MPPIKRKGLWAACLALVPVLVLATFLAWPLAATAQRAVAPSSTQASSPSPRAIWSALATTLQLAGAGTLLAVGIGVAATWALYRRGWPGSRLLAAALTAPFALPTVVVALAFSTLARDYLPWLSSWHGVPAIVCALGFFNISVVIRTVGPALERVDERLLLAAATLGAAPARATMRIVWPLMRAPLASAAALIFMFCSTSFAIVLVLGGGRVRTLETSAYLELTTFVNLRSASIIALIQALLIASIATLAHVTSRHYRAGAQTPPALRPRATRRHAALIALGLLPAVTLTAVPMLALVSRSLRQHSGWSTSSYRALWDGDLVVGLQRGLTWSLTIAAIATLASVVVGMLAALSSRLHAATRWVANFSVAPLAISSTVLGVGLLVGLAVPLRHLGGWVTVTLLVAAQAIIAIPLVVRIVTPAIEQLSDLQMTAAATLGAGPARTALSIGLPQLRPAIVSAGGLAFAVSIGEFGASIFLTKPDIVTLPTAIAKLMARPGVENVSAASAGAVVLAVITGAAVLLTDVSRRTTR